MNISKKLFIIIIAVLAIALAAGFFVFKYFSETQQKTNTPAENQNNQTQNNQNNQIETRDPQIQIQAEGIEIQNDNGGLTICLDKCGDNICQPADPECKSSMNCICPETSEVCPQDCGK